MILKATRKQNWSNQWWSFRAKSYGDIWECAYSNANQLFDVDKFKVVGGSNVYSPMNNHQ